MNTIIAGGRDIDNYDLLLAALSKCPWRITGVISGCANGADKLGERWAKEKKIPVKRFPADWETHGKSAGQIRNREMAACAEALVALWDGKSRGTEHMIAEAQKRGLSVHVHRTDQEASCNHCQEIQAERAAIHEFDGGCTRKQAEELAWKERCRKHQPAVTAKIPVDDFKSFDSL